jgi:hypothetical protein
MPGLCVRTSHTSSPKNTLYLILWFDRGTDKVDACLVQYQVNLCEMYPGLAQGRPAVRRAHLWGQLRPSKAYRIP